MLPGQPGDPLVDLGVSYVMETGVELTADDVMAVRSTLGKFVHGLISYQDVAMLLSPIIGTTQAIDRIDRILRTPLTPLPSHPVGPDRQSRAKTRPWSAYEDQRLIAGLHRLGMSDWFAIACFVGNNRTKSQCYQRWTRGLDPNINKTKWSPEQDSYLMMLVAVYGDKAWSKISGDIGNRCDVQCRYRYKQLLKDERFPEMQRKAREAASQFAQTAGPVPRRPNGKQSTDVCVFAPPPQTFPFYPGWVPLEYIDYRAWPAPPVPMGPTPDQICRGMRPVPMLPHTASGVIIYQNPPLFPAAALRPAASLPFLKPDTP